MAGRRWPRIERMMKLFVPALALIGLAVANAELPALRVGRNHRCLVDSDSQTPVFILADTAWNLGALKLEEIDVYLKSRADHGFNVVMFAVNFAPQADEKNAYGQAAYIGPEKTELNPAYFETCDAIVKRCGDRGIYVMMFAMWGGRKSGTMNGYTPDQLEKLGRALGQRYRGVKNVIFCAGGESTPNFVDVDRVKAIGKGLKDGCGGENLVTLHPTAGHSTSRFFAKAEWLDFYMSQAKSGSSPESVTYDAAALVMGDAKVEPLKPTMMAEHRYEVGTGEDPLIQRRSLYQCVFAGGFGYAYGHNALWQMTPHTGQRWMLDGWKPGVGDWKDALETKAVSQLSFIRKLLAKYPDRVPDQSLVLDGQGKDVATRVQVARDGGNGSKDTRYLMAYISSPQNVTLDTHLIKGEQLNLSWFSPATGVFEMFEQKRPNTGKVTVEKRETGTDWVLVIEDASR
jgi:hypothetical protein